MTDRRVLVQQHIQRRTPSKRRRLISWHLCPACCDLEEWQKLKQREKATSDKRKNTYTEEEEEEDDDDDDDDDKDDEDDNKEGREESRRKS